MVNSACSSVVVNGTLHNAEYIWGLYAADIVFDGEGYWTEPTKQLLVNAIDEATGKMVQAPIKHLYRQQVSTSLRKVQLEDGSSITITYPHKLLTNKGWTNELRVGDYVCVPAKLLWEGQPQDPDLVKFLAWQIAEGYEGDLRQLTITQKDVSILEELQSCLHRLKERYGVRINTPSICTPLNKAAYLRLASVEYRRFLENLGYSWGRLSRDKYIPDFIMQADLNSIRIFLSNIFEAEASVLASICVLLRLVLLTSDDPTAFLSVTSFRYLDAHIHKTEASNKWDWNLSFLSIWRTWRKRYQKILSGDRICRDWEAEEARENL